MTQKSESASSENNESWKSFGKDIWKLFALITIFVPVIQLLVDYLPVILPENASELCLKFISWSVVLGGFGYIGYEFYSIKKGKSYSQNQWCIAIAVLILVLLLATFLGELVAKHKLRELSKDNISIEYQCDFSKLLGGNYSEDTIQQMIELSNIMHDKMQQKKIDEQLNKLNASLKKDDYIVTCKPKEVSSEN